jgi:hypothetical protein
MVDFPMSQLPFCSFPFDRAVVGVLNKYPSGRRQEENRDVLAWEQTHKFSSNQNDCHSVGAQKQKTGQ